MLYVFIVSALLAVGFWRSVLKMLIIVLVALLLLGGIQAVRALGLVTATQEDALGWVQSATHSTTAAGNRGVGTRPSTTFTRNSTANLLV